MIYVPATTFLELLKAKPAAEGEVRTWADGYKRKKVGKKWVVVGSAPTIKEKLTSQAEKHFNYAMASNLGDIVDDILEDFGIKSFEALENKIKTGTSDTAHKIYKQVVDRVKASTGSNEDKKAVMHFMGVSLVNLRDTYGGAKASLTVKKKSKTGKEYYVKDAPGGPPTLKATTISKAKKKMGGWSVTGDLSTSHVREMLKLGSAKLISGKIDSKKKWHMPKKAKDITFKYKGDSLEIQARQIRKAGTQERSSAVVSIAVPYAYVHAFLNAHIKSTKTRNSFLFKIEHSQGYRNFIDKGAA